MGEGERFSEPEVMDDSKETGPPDTTGHMNSQTVVAGTRFAQVQVRVSSLRKGIGERVHS